MDLCDSQMSQDTHLPLSSPSAEMRTVRALQGMSSRSRQSRHRLRLPELAPALACYNVEIYCMRELDHEYL